MQRGGFLLLEDGTRFDGEAFYGASPSLGEAVFNTSHSGYQEILSDPSYRGQVMVFTAPHIGNVGINAEDVESDRVQAAGAVVRSLASRPRNWRSDGDLPSWLNDGGAPLLAGVDTRAVTLHLRTRGAMRCGLFPDTVPEARALEQVKASPSMEGADLTRDVACESPYVFSGNGLDPRWHAHVRDGEGLRVGVLDYGVKRNILRELARRGCEVNVLPGNTSSGDVLEKKYDGVLVSNGPGDPAAVSYGIDTVRGLTGNVPLFGICLGHQLLSLAVDMETYKLPFGHRGANHPVRREDGHVVEITSQNHGFAVRPDRVPTGWNVTHVNLNDGTVEGLEQPDLAAFSIQYHPEASPGPHDGLVYFDKFIRLMRNR